MAVMCLRMTGLKSEGEMREGGVGWDGRVALIVQFAMYQDIFSFRIFGDLENYTFLETLGPSESEKQCLHFSKHPMAAILDFKMATVFF